MRWQRSPQSSTQAAAAISILLSRTLPLCHAPSFVLSARLVKIEAGGARDVLERARRTRSARGRPFELTLVCLHSKKVDWQHKALHELLPPAAKMMFAACASPGRPDADRVMSLLTEKIEQKVGSMAATKITRELRRVLKPAADKDGFLSSKALAEMLRRTWLVGVERDSLEAFADQLTAQQKHGKLSIDTFALCVARAATGNPVVTPPKAKQVEVRTPEDNGLYVDPLQGANVAPPTDASSSKLRSLLADELRRVERDRIGEMAHANEVDAAARSLLKRRCRARCERGSKTDPENVTAGPVVRGFAWFSYRRRAAPSFRSRFGGALARLRPGRLRCFW